MVIIKKCPKTSNGYGTSLSGPSWCQLCSNPVIEHSIHDIHHYLVLPGVSYVVIL